MQDTHDFVSLVHVLVTWWWLERATQVPVRSLAEHE
jgi:hypothetical protein